MQQRLAACLVGVALATVYTVTSMAQTTSTDPWIGTWKVNLQKSTFSPGPQPTVGATIKVESPANGIKVTVDGMTPKGEPFHTEVVGAFDGKDNPVKGGPAPNMTTAYRRIDNRSFEATSKTDGKPTTTNRVVISADGKTMTANISGKNAEGQTVNNVIVAEKQ